MEDNKSRAYDWRQRWMARASALCIEVHALILAGRHPGTPRAARWLIAGVIAYALSPIDLIPDFIPVLGHVDDLLIVPAGLWLARRMVPQQVMAECRKRAESRSPQQRSV